MYHSVLYPARPPHRACYVISETVDGSPAIHILPEKLDIGGPQASEERLMEMDQFVSDDMVHPGQADRKRQHYVGRQVRNPPGKLTSQRTHASSIERRQLVEARLDFTTKSLHS